MSNIHHPDRTNGRNEWVVTYPKGTVSVRYQDWLRLHCHHANDHVSTAQAKTNRDGWIMVTVWTNKNYSAYTYIQNTTDALRLLKTKYFYGAYIHWIIDSAVPKQGWYQNVNGSLVTVNEEVKEIDKGDMYDDDEFTEPDALLGQSS